MNQRSSRAKKCYCNSLSRCFYCIKIRVQKENAEISRNLAPPNKRLEFLQKIFTPEDLKFVKGKTIHPLVGAPWLKPHYGCKQTKTKRFGQYLIRIRASLIYHGPDEPFAFFFTAAWARVEDPKHFMDFCGMFDEKFKRGYQHL